MSGKQSSNADIEYSLDAPARAVCTWWSVEANRFTFNFASNKSSWMTLPSSPPHFSVAKPLLGVFLAGAPSSFFATFFGVGFGPVATILTKLKHRRYSCALGAQVPWTRRLIVRGRAAERLFLWQVWDGALSCRGGCTCPRWTRNRIHFHDDGSDGGRGGWRGRDLLLLLLLLFLTFLPLALEDWVIASCCAI